MRAAGLVLAIGLVLVASCGDDDDDDGGSAAGAPTAATGAAIASTSAASTSGGGCEAPDVLGTMRPDGSVERAASTDEEHRAAIVAMFCAPDPANPATLPEAEARCIASGLEQALGLDRLRQLPFGAGPWSLIGVGLGANIGGSSLARAEAEAIVEVFAGCTASWEQLMIRSVTGGAETIGDESASCIAERLDDAQARVIFAGELDRAYDDPSAGDAVPFPELVRPLEDAFDACVTAEERARVDWN
jgi:hypothetical protein